jgi:hypothetical protein
MDPRLIKLARQLQTKLARIDDQADPDAFESVYGLLIELIDCIETAMPGLGVHRLIAQAKANREKATRILKKMRLEANRRDGRRRSRLPGWCPRKKKTEARSCLVGVVRKSASCLKLNHWQCPDRKGCWFGARMA